MQEKRENGEVGARENGEREGERELRGERMKRTRREERERVETD